MTSQILESRSSPLYVRPTANCSNDELREPVSSVLAAYRQHTSSMTPYWPTNCPSGDVIMTSYGVSAPGYVVHSVPPPPPPPPSALGSPWATGAPPTVGGDRLSQLNVSCGTGGAAAGYGSHVVGSVPALSAYAELKPWTVNNYMPSPPSAVSPPFHAFPPLMSIHGTLGFLKSCETLVAINQYHIDVPFSSFVRLLDR